MIPIHGLTTTKISNSISLKIIKKTDLNQNQKRMLFDQLPLELICKIYEFDPTKRENFNKVYHQIRMRQVWFEAHCIPKWRTVFRYNSNLLQPDNSSFYRTEESYEAYVHLECRWQRLHGRKPRLPFDDFDLVSTIVTQQPNLYENWEEEEDDFY